MSDAVLRLEEISKSFGALQVTKSISLSVRQGEILALIGPNGAGKSTLIGQIAGSISPDSGRVFFHGREVTNLDVPARARLGLARVFQTPSLIGSFTALENAALAAQAKASRQISFWKPVSEDGPFNEQAHAALEAVGMLARAKIKAHALSHGEKRALEIAVALVQRPSLLLLDEPFAGMGREETRAIMRFLGRMKGQAAMLLVEHDMEAVFAVADRIAVL
ncbi:MAG TPA: ATP-binding cassette domain-containing protein, partial [Hyphomicrobiales bacterium]|nr:ATP-binding cassette domain-containing protein [Hyphomicrobiales bacterium]